MSIQIGSPRGEEQPVAEAGLPEGLPVLPLREVVPFPDALTPLAIGQERSVQLVNDVLGGERMLAMVASRNSAIEVPEPGDLYEVGVACKVTRVINVPEVCVRAGV